MSAGHFAAAAESARHLLKGDPAHALLWKTLGLATLMQGQDAVRELERARELLPADAEVHYYLGTALQGSGQPEAARGCYQQAVRIRPKFAEAHAGLGTVWRALGQPEAALASYRQALEIRPAFPEAIGGLSNVLRDQGRIAEAADGYRRVLQISPDMAEAHNNLGSALLELGQPEQAIDSYRQALRVRPRYAEALCNLANALRDMGDLAEAVVRYRRALEIRPTFPEAIGSLSNVLRDQGRIAEAADGYRRLLQISPDMAEAHNNLGSALLELGQPERAVECFGRALALKPDLTEARIGLAIVQRQLGDVAEAEATIRTALSQVPQAAPALALLAELRADQGQFAEAEVLFGQALAINPELPEALAGRARSRRMSLADDAWLAGTQRALAKVQTLRHQINLRFALGKYFDDVQDYSQAFSNYRAANELSRRIDVHYDRAQQTRLVDRLIHKYSRAWFASRSGAGSQSERPLFIIGMPRSGTTLAEQILASHPAVFGAGELMFWNEASAALELGSTRQEPFAAMADRYLQQLQRLSTTALRVVDKMPINFLNLGLIQTALPAARIIHMQRHPIDTCLSIYFQHFSVSYNFARDLEDLAHYYQEYRRLMLHWRAVLPPEAILDVPYEGLVEDLESWSRRMVEFAGLTWEPRCLEFHLTARTVTSSSRWQVRQKLHSGARGRWRHYEPFLGPLRALLEAELS
ncbi:MAG: tetratricopeptide repeat protein [Steroidobacteraceae bacterium]